VALEQSSRDGCTVDRNERRMGTVILKVLRKIID
jgi:hypothetical protein